MSARSTAYDILGIRPDASQSEIKSAYRSLARRLHPDVYKHAGPDDEDPWPPVQRSYTILSDQPKRLVYDDIVVRGKAMRLADPERFERWFNGHIHVDYETGTVRKGSEFFHQMGRTELLLLHNRHRIGWGVTAALAAGYGMRAWTAWLPPEDAVDASSDLHASRARTAFLGGLLGGAGAAWGQLAYNPPIRSLRAAAVAAGFATASACAGALSVGAVFRAATGHDPALADEPAVRAAHANGARVFQAAGATVGASHAARAAPAIGKAHGRVALAGLVGGAVGALCERLLRSQAPARPHVASPELF